MLKVPQARHKKAPAPGRPGLERSYWSPPVPPRAGTAGRTSSALPGSPDTLVTVFQIWEFPKIGVPYFGVLLIGIHYLGCYLRFAQIRKLPYNIDIESPQTRKPKPQTGIPSDPPKKVYFMKDPFKEPYRSL